MTPSLSGLGRNRKIAGDGRAPLSGSRGVDQWLGREGELRLAVACRGEDGVVKRRRRVLEQPRDAAGACNDNRAMDVAHRLAAFGGEECNCDPLGDDESKQQQQRELARQAARYRTHSCSTLPANR